MKGTGESYGVPDVTPNGAPIETAGEERDLEAAEAAIGQLRTFLDEAARSAA